MTGHSKATRMEPLFMALNRAKKATKTTTSRLTMVHTTWPLMFSAKATYVTMVAV